MEFPTGASVRLPPAVWILSPRPELFSVTLITGIFLSGSVYSSHLQTEIMEEDDKFSASFQNSVRMSWKLTTHQSVSDIATSLDGKEHIATLLSLNFSFMLTLNKVSDTLKLKILSSNVKIE